MKLGKTRMFVVNESVRQFYLVMYMFLTHCSTDPETLASEVVRQEMRRAQSVVLTGVEPTSRAVTVPDAQTFNSVYKHES